MKGANDDKSKKNTSSISTKASVIAKQVIKPNAIPQQVKSPSSHPIAKPKTQPQRSSKVSQKLVVFPQSTTEPDNLTSSVLPSDPQEAQEATLHTLPPYNPVLEERQRQQQQGEDFASHMDYSPHQHVLYSEQWSHQATGMSLPTEWTFQSRTKAERMTKDERDFAQLPRVAAYCTGEGYSLARLRSFLREHHHASTRQYDEALYAAYHFPLMTLRPDKDNLYNIRVRSASPRLPALGRFVSSESHENMLSDPYRIVQGVPSVDSHVLGEMARSPEDRLMDYEEDHYNENGSAQFDCGTSRPGYPYPSYLQHHEDSLVHTDHSYDSHPPTDYQQEQPMGFPEQHTSSNVDDPAYPTPTATQDDQPAPLEGDYVQHKPDEPPLPSPLPPRAPFTGGEVFIFDYGVVVFWNFRRAEELLMLEDLHAFCGGPFRDNPDEDMQIEEMHFQYDTSQLKPRIFNDMITMKTGNHMIKLTLSHGLSQSALLARYEDIMDKTIEDTKHLPKEMAETGRLGKSRCEITKINGQLFQLRMNVNLVSNVLDTPEIFWSEPSLQPMYNAIREYLEIAQRAKILNDRLRVVSDLLSMLRDHLTNFGVEYQTLIIIYLIIVAVIVACFEIAVKILQSLKVY